MSDLSTLLREHVGRDEPFLPPDAAPSIARGRRRLRGRRVVAATTTALAAVVVTALAVPVLGSGGDGADGSGVDPATRRALREYDAQAMPGIMVDHVGAVLGRHSTAPPERRFYASNDDGALGPADYDRASTMSLVYGSGTDHVIEVSLAQARSEAEGDARKSCSEGVDSLLYVSCEVTVTDAGDVVTSRLTAVRPMHDLVNQPSTWRVVYTDRLDRIDPTRLWFSHDVKVVHSETFVTYASEIVKAPSAAAADRLFQVPVGDLVDIATDPELVIPPLRQAVP